MKPASKLLYGLKVVQLQELADSNCTAGRYATIYTLLFTNILYTLTLLL